MEQQKALETDAIPQKVISVLAILRKLKNLRSLLSSYSSSCLGFLQCFANEQSELVERQHELEHAPSLNSLEMF